MFKQLKKIENLIAILVTVSVAGIVIHQAIPREFSIRPGDDWRTMTTDDRNEGGKSIANDQSTQSQFAYSYDISNSKTNAFAAFMIWPSVDDTLYDLRWMETVSITGYVEGRESENYRFQFRNCDEKYSVPGDSVSRRYNEVSIKLTNQSTTQTIATDKFYVPGWWVERMSIPIEDSTPSFDNVEWVEFNTGSVTKEGECRVIIEEIKISGHWIPTSIFYQSILGMWLGFGSLVALRQIIGLQRRLSQSQSMELSLQRQKAELAELATLDSLTQLFNRRGLRSHTTLAMRELRRTGKSFNLIMFDIDNFKKLNDENGHSHGDHVLQQVARIVSESVTVNDPAARWGGEEFVIISRNGDLDRATKLAEQIRQRIEREVEVTCSFGVCEVGRESEFSEALDLVDECLYLAKRDGKNCVKTTNCIDSSNSTPALIEDSANF